MSISSITTFSVSKSVYKDIHHFLFKVYKNPCDESQPFPIKEISKIEIESDDDEMPIYAVHYVSPNNKNESLLVYGWDLQKV
tara:strand:- start:1101 stop:1346 length:246 start_codon:yes stop_codon:yes gene_type:complete